MLLVIVKWLLCNELITVFLVSGVIQSGRRFGQVEFYLQTFP